MSTGHRNVNPDEHGFKQYEEHSQLLHELLDNPQFEAAVKAYTKEDDQYDIPFLGGSNNAGDTVYFDRSFIEACKAGKVKYDGQAFDPRPFLHVHEAVEGAAIRLLGAKYDTSNVDGLPGGHCIATWAERRAVEHSGMDWVQYQSALEPFIETDEHEKVRNPPPDLLTTPYKGTPQDKEVEGGYVPAQKAIAHPFPLPDPGIVRQPNTGVGYDANAYQPDNVMRDSYNAPSRIEGGYVSNPDRKLAHAAVSYGRGHADGDHCAVCRHYVPDGPHCGVVVDPIASLGWCERFSRGRSVMTFKQTAVPNPQASVTDKTAAVLHPRMHSLAIAAANHLHKMGHISAPQKARIGVKSKAGINQLKQKPVPAFGSLSPDVDRDGM